MQFTTLACTTILAAIGVSAQPFAATIDLWSHGGCTPNAVPDVNGFILNPTPCNFILPNARSANVTDVFPGCTSMFACSPLISLALLCCVAWMRPLIGSNRVVKLFQTSDCTSGGQFGVITVTKAPSQCRQLSSDFLSYSATCV
jgi:hypothetical protein